MAQKPSPFDEIRGILNVAGTQQAQDAHNLLTFAKQQNYHITSGYSHGTKHSPNSMHYQGNEHDPGAIDIDYKGVNLANLQKIAADRGYTVLDEVNHPSKYSTGPHYHIQKQRGGQAQVKHQQKDILKPSTPVQAVPDKPVDLLLPLTQDIHGNILTRNQAPGVTGSQIDQYVQSNMPQPAQLNTAPATPAGASGKSSDFDSIRQILSAANKPKPAAPLAPPKQPGLLENIATGALDMGKGALEGLRKEILPTTEEIRASAPHSIQEAIYNAAVRDNPYAQIGAGALSEAANFVNGATDLVGLGKPIPTGGLQNFTESHPLYSSIGRAGDYALGEAGLAKAGMKLAPGITKALTANPLSRIATGAGVNAAEGYLVDPGEAGQQGRLQNAALSGLIGGGAHGVMEMLGHGKPALAQASEIVPESPPAEPKQFKTQADIIRNLGDLEHKAKANEILSVLDEPFVPTEGMEGHLPQNGFVNRKGEVLGRFRGEAPPVELTPKVEMLNKPDAVAGLNEGFTQRVYDAKGQPQVIDPRNAPIPEDLGPVKTEPTETGLQIATRSGTREIPKIETEPGVSRPAGRVDLLDSQGQSINKPKPGQIDILKPNQEPPATLEYPQSFDTPERMPAKTQEAGVPTTKTETTGNIYRTSEGGEVYTHGRDPAEIQKQLEGVKGQIANIADIERHLQAHNPDAAPAIRNVLDAGKNSEAVKFSYTAREAPGEPVRVRDNFIPTHFTYETIKPATQRAFLRRKFGSDDSVISHLKQEILSKGGAVNAANLQTKGGSDIAQATQISRLINQLNDQTGGAYLKSPRVHGINMGETTRSAAGDRGIRLDTITDSSLTGRKVAPEELSKSGHSYNNQIAPAVQALNDLADAQASPVFKRAVKQIQKGEINGKTVRELKAALGDKDLAAQFCNVLGVKP